MLFKALSFASVCLFLVGIGLTCYGDFRADFSHRVLDLPHWAIIVLGVVLAAGGLVLFLIIPTDARDSRFEYDDDHQDVDFDLD